MRKRKKVTATQVTVVTNSYMSPHGTRCTASPRLTTPTMCAASPTTVRPTATCTQRPIPPASGPAPGPVGGGAGATAPGAGPRRGGGRRARARPGRAPGGAGAWRAPGRPRIGGPRGRAHRDEVGRLLPGWLQRADRVPPEGEVAREGQHRQGIGHDGDHECVVAEVGQPPVDGHGCHSSSVGASAAGAPPSVPAPGTGAGLRAGTAGSLPWSAALIWPARLGNSVSKPPAASERARPPTSTTVVPSGPGRARTKIRR